jgi:acyl-CoA synthetase (NDP forming)
MLTKRCFPTAFLTILASVQGISYEPAPLDENGIPKYKGRKRGRKPKKRLRKRNPNAKKRSHTAYTLVSRFHTLLTFAQNLLSQLSYGYYMIHSPNE